MSFSGTFQLSVSTPSGIKQGDLRLHQDGDDLTGDLSQEGERSLIKQGRVTGNEGHFEVEIREPMAIKLIFDAVRREEGITGTVQIGEFGNASFEAVEV